MDLPTVFPRVPVNDVDHGATGDVDWLIVHKASFIVRLVLLVPNIISATITMMTNANLQEEKNTFETEVCD